MEVFNPFREMIFDDRFCFLTGDLTTESMTVFPEWLMEHFGLGEEEMELMDNSEVKKVPYKELRIPCAPRVKKAYEDLDAKFRVAYEKGYEGIKELDEKVLFHWSGRMVYGLLYLEMLGEWERHQKIGKNFDLNKKLKKRLGTFHLMLQNLVEPVYFSERKPWSLTVFPLKYSADILSFRDDVINMLFQFGVNGFGFIISFMDNGAIADRENDLLEKMQGHTLHPVQFEELFARFHYSADLLQYQPRYDIIDEGDEVTINALPVVELNKNIPVFGLWEDDFFARLLSNYWQVYGIEKGQIIRYQEPMLSYLEAPYTKEFIDINSIGLPY